MSATVDRARLKALETAKRVSALFSDRGKTNEKEQRNNGWAQKQADRRRYARTLGNCIIHIRTKAVSKSYCQPCLEKQRNKSLVRISTGKCATHPDRALVSKTRCQECLDQRNNRRKRFIISRVCWKCGDRPPKEAKGRCQDCLDVAKDQQLRRTFNITLITYNKMLKKQGGVCWICRRLSKGVRHMAVDHSHITGKLRGLLCTACNTSLGAVNDNVQVLNNMVEYLTVK